MPTTPFEYQKGGLNMISTYVFPMRGEWGMDGDGAKGLPPLEELAAGQPDTDIRGYLKAWDPIAQTLVWQLEVSDQWVGTDFAFWNGGGVMSTAGGLVFQGRGSGEFTAVDASTGEKLLSLQVGSSMMAAPMTYSIDGEQYIAIMAALGGGGGQAFPPGSAAYEYGNAGRIIVLKLGGGVMPIPPRIERINQASTQPPVLRRGNPDQVESGSVLFTQQCAKCHATMDGRGSGIPDLRYMTGASHTEFNDILLKGTRADKGMGNFSSLLSPADVEAIHSYLIEWAWQTYEQNKEPSKPHQPSGNM
jgi:quinohemoprotein ethanol dehydrogenase